jgi:hypothetical protein
MQWQRLSSWQNGVQGFLAIWLGLLLPLLCVPTINSNHTHGLHWVWETPEREAEATHSHSHSHGESHAHSHAAEPAPAPTPSSVPDGILAFSSNPTPQVEQLMNLFGMMGTVPTGLPLPVIAGLALLVGIAWLFRAVPPLAPPWHPPKAYS